MMKKIAVYLFLFYRENFKTLGLYKIKKRTLLAKTKLYNIIK